MSIEITLEYAVPPNPYHPAISLSLNKFVPPPTLSSISFFDFSKADLPRIKSFLNSYYILNHLFLSTLMMLWNISWMLSTHQFFHLSPKYTSNILFIHLSINTRANKPHEKTKAHTLYKKPLSLIDYRSFSIIRARCKVLSIKSYKVFIARIESSLLTNLAPHLPFLAMFFMVIL